VSGTVRRLMIVVLWLSAAGMLYGAVVSSSSPSASVGVRVGLWISFALILIAATMMPAATRRQAATAPERTRGATR